jgi:hypothetical protein
MKNLMDMRKMVSVHQGRERSDVFLVILLPAFLMLMSSYTNAWAMTEGHLLFDQADLLNTLFALFKGLFIEVLVFAMFMQARILASRGGLRGVGATIIPALVGLFGVLVSSGCGLAWAAHAGDAKAMVAMVASLSFPFVATVFQMGLGLLFPVALAVLAIYDAGHVVKEHVNRGAEMSELATAVESAEHFQQMMLAAQKQENEKMRPVIQQIVAANAQRAVESAKTGDLSFGLRDAMRTTQQLQQQQAARSSVTPLSPLAQTRQLLPPVNNMASTMSFAVPQQQPPVNGQFGPAPMMRSGTTQNIVVPPAPMPAPPAAPYGSNNGNNPPYPNPYQR